MLDQTGGPLLSSLDVMVATLRTALPTARAVETGQNFLSSLREVAAEKAPEPFKGLHVGSRGPAVARLQQILNKWNPRLGVQPTGVYDQGTKRAVMLFQAIYGEGGDGARLEEKAAGYLRQMGDGSFWKNPPAKTPAQEMLYHASRKLGTPYVLGGDGDSTIDCGMLTRVALRGSGVDKSASRLADEQYRAARTGKNGMSLQSSPKPGDLVFFRTGGSQASEAYGGVTHVGLYVGHGQMLAASSSAGKVIVQRVSDLGDCLAGYGRPRA